ncbi:hypothetical protein LCGC14_1183360 [marine sediment metagenome]|uniref:Uncharacterized protein n=1 Tax=marine sediment metagenome TaxID=412755 RepID=A0A0F9P4C9_9ZZZZ
MSCVPQYPFRPKFVASDVKCIALTFEEHRSRLFGGGTFFRSIAQGRDRNQLSLEVTVVSTGPLTFDVTLFVRFGGGSPVETFMVTQTENGIGDCISGGISALRSAVNSSSTLISMPARGTDFFDSGTDAATGCMSAFSDTSMTGGDGELDPSVPADLAAILTIRTGPTRTLLIISTTENAVGFPVTPPSSNRVRQFDGTVFISFSNLVAGSCPIDV